MTNRKMLLVLLIAVFAVFSTSCKKDNNDTLKIKVNNYNLVKNITDPNGNYVFPNGVVDDESPVRVNLFIYDQNDKLCHSETKNMDDFATVADFSIDVDPGTYTIVATADIVEMKNGKITFECWEFSETSSLNDFIIYDLGYMGYHYKMLGVSVNTINVSNSLKINNSSEIEIETKSAGALITLLFQNVADSQISYLAYMFEKSNDYYDVAAEKSYMLNEETYDEIGILPEFTGYYAPYYLLGAGNVSFVWGTFTANKETIETGSTIVNVTAGGHKTVTIDLAANKVAIAQPGDINAVGKQSLHVKSLKNAAPPAISSKLLK